MTRAERRPDGRWDVRPTGARRASYDALVVANGHHWDPRWPEPAFSGARPLRRRAMHSHDYTGEDPELFRDKHVVVLGMGNSAMDIAVEASFVAPRDLPRRPPRRLGDPEVPVRPPAGPAPGVGARAVAVRRRVQAARCWKLDGRRHERYGLPKPDHRVRRGAPDRSDDMLARIAQGEIVPKPNIAELTERTVRFADGSEVDADVVVYCTGYRVTFPFLDPA